jgi:hypothetical protein
MNLRSATFARLSTILPALLSPLAALALLFLTGCGSLVDMGGSNTVDPRRVYVNDLARNDSLATALPGRGVLFVLQPGQDYTLRMKKTGSSVDILDFYVPSGSNFSLKGTVTGTRQGDVVTFPVSPLADRTTAGYYLAFLRAADGGRATAPDSGVRLVPVDTSGSATVAVRLLMVRQLNSPYGPGYMDATTKSVYARAFHTRLKAIYAKLGITLDTSTVVVEPDGAPFSVDFASGTPTIPGTRGENAINLYLVDSIGSGGTDGIILGFAPREAFDLSGDIESRVLLNVQGGSPTSMAATAAHEMGHFLGLRHTTATEVDRGFDDDDSNRDDGFASTPFCASLTKSAAAASEITRVRGGRAYCLRVAGNAFTCSCSDAYNMMYPYACSAYAQDTLGLDQRTFIRNNLKLYQ